MFIRNEDSNKLFYKPFKAQILGYDIRKKERFGAFIGRILLKIFGISAPLIFFRSASTIPSTSLLPSISSARKRKQRGIAKLSYQGNAELSSLENVKKDTQIKASKDGFLSREVESSTEAFTQRSKRHRTLRENFLNTSHKRRRPL